MPHVIISPSLMRFLDTILAWNKLLTDINHFILLCLKKRIHVFFSSQVSVRFRDISQES